MTNPTQKPLEEPVHLKWHSPYEQPEGRGSNARRVLVWLEVRNDPSALNAPGRLTFGHRIVYPRANPPEHWPENGWFHDEHRADEDGEYWKVACWAYADEPVKGEDY